MTHQNDTQWTLGILGGSGLYDLAGLENPEWVSVSSPWGEPSDDILFAEMNGVRLRFLPRHGRGHAISPSDVNYRYGYSLYLCRRQFTGTLRARRFRDGQSND